MEASAASMSTTERFDDVAGSGDAEQPPPTGAAHEATAVQHLRPMPDDDPLSDRAAGEAPSASIVSSSDAVESTPCPKCANKHARTNHTCSKARKAPTVSALLARASRRSRSDAGSVADQPASKAPRLSMPHATSRNAGLLARMSRLASARRQRVSPLRWGPTTARRVHANLASTPWSAIQARRPKWALLSTACCRMRPRWYRPIKRTRPGASVSPTCPSRATLPLSLMCASLLPACVVQVVVDDDAAAESEADHGSSSSLSMDVQSGALHLYARSFTQCACVACTHTHAHFSPCRTSCTSCVRLVHVRRHVHAFFTCCMQCPGHLTVTYV